MTILLISVFLIGWTAAAVIGTTSVFPWRTNQADS